MQPFPNFELVHCFMSSSNCCFLTFTQVLQDIGKVVCYSHLFKNSSHMNLPSFSFPLFLFPFWPNLRPVQSYYLTAATAAKSLQSCPTLRNPTDCSPPGSSVHGILQARVLEWGAIAFSNCHDILF